MAIGFPARHDKASLNCSPGSRGGSSSMTAVVAETALLEGMANIKSCSFSLGLLSFHK